MKKRILRLFYITLLLVTTTAAWILSGETTKVKWITVNYDHQNLSVANVNIDASIWVLNAATQAYEPATEAFRFAGSDVIPGKTIPFRIRMRNTSATDIKANMTMYINVPASVEEQERLERLFTKLFIEIKPGDGYYGVHLDSLYIRFDDADRVLIEGEEKYALALYHGDEKLTIPRVGEGDTGTELNCSFYFDETADASYQDVSFTIDYFRMEQ